jgi:hypothetical protein
LVYKGRRRSHRFTILGDTAFEYDCILEREPESNVITLFMEGAEKFDFFRQPDFINDPFLAGSYAVYKKETFIGEGTGKLCHIHRPEIIDSRGRRCRGDLSVTGNELRITIPEKWLSEAEYPVIVDPTIGTTTTGSQIKIYNPYMEVEHNLIFHCQIPVNRFLAPETVYGPCTATVYVNYATKSTFDRPVMYSDDTGKPLAKLTGDEGVIDFSGLPGSRRDGGAPLFPVTPRLRPARTAGSAFLPNTGRPPMITAGPCTRKFWEPRITTWRRYPTCTPRIISQVPCTETCCPR